MKYRSETIDLTNKCYRCLVINAICRFKLTCGTIRMRLPNGWLCDERWGVGGRLRSKEEASVEFRLWFWSYRCPDVKISLKKNLKQESIFTSIKSKVTNYSLQQSVRSIGYHYGSREKTCDSLRQSLTSQVSVAMPEFGF